MSETYNVPTTEEVLAHDKAFKYVCTKLLPDSIDPSTREKITEIRGSFIGNTPIFVDWKNDDYHMSAYFTPTMLEDGAVAACLSNDEYINSLLRQDKNDLSMYNASSVWPYLTPLKYGKVPYYLPHFNEDLRTRTAVDVVGYEAGHMELRNRMLVQDTVRRMIDPDAGGDVTELLSTLADDLFFSFSVRAASANEINLTDASKMYDVWSKRAPSVLLLSNREKNQTTLADSDLLHAKFVRTMCEYVTGEPAPEQLNAHTLDVFLHQKLELDQCLGSDGFTGAHKLAMLGRLETRPGLMKYVYDTLDNRAVLCADFASVDAKQESRSVSYLRAFLGSRFSLLASPVNWGSMDLTGAVTELLVRYMPFGYNGDQASANAFKSWLVSGVVWLNPNDSLTKTSSIGNVRSKLQSEASKSKLLCTLVNMASNNHDALPGFADAKNSVIVGLYCILLYDPK